MTSNQQNKQNPVSSRDNLALWVIVGVAVVLSYKIVHAFQTPLHGAILEVAGVILAIVLSSLGFLAYQAIFNRKDN